MTEKIDSSMAERWLDPDTFIYKGKAYRYDWIACRFTIKEISPDTEVQAVKKEGTK